MKELLSFQERRIVNILYALTVEHFYLTLKEIQTMNECSDRTVLSDIERIRDFWGDKIELNNFENVLFLQDNSMGKLHQYIYDVLNQSLLCNLLVSVFFNPEENMDFHALETHISTSHALRTLNDIDAFLKRHDLMISKTSGKHFVEGNSEANLRYFMSEFLIQYQPIKKTFTNKKLMMTLLGIVKEAFEFKGISLNELMLNQMTLVFYVSILREKQGFALMDSIDQFEDFDFRVDETLEFTKEEVKAGLNQFNDFIFVYNKNLHLEKTLHDTFDKFIKKHNLHHVFKDADIISKPTYIFMILTYCNPTELERLLDRTVIFGKESKKTKAKTFELIYETIDNFSPNMKNFLLKHLDQLIFWISLEISNYDIGIQKKVLIISDLGEQHASDLKTFIELFYGHHHFNSASTINGLAVDVQKTLDDYDLIISTTLIDNESSTPCIEINDYISESDMGRIFTALRKR